MDVTMPKGLEARQVRAIFFPERKYYAFHRINMEYLAALKSMNRESICALLSAGLQHNLRNTGGNSEVLNSLRPQLEGVANRINVQGFRLQRVRELADSQLALKSREGYSAYRAELGLVFANRKLSESLVLQSTQAYDSVLTAAHTLKNALQVDHRNYRAHFELGWMYLCLLDSLEHAEFHLACAARLAWDEQDHEFSVFAMRHLGDACYSQQKYDKAIHIAKEVIRVAPQPDREHLYECARYMAAGGEVKAATHRLAAIVNQDPAYYVQAQIEPDFNQHAEIKDMLYELRRSRVQRIQHYVRTTWQNHRLSRMILPERIDPGQVLKKTLDRHVRVMAQQPYGVLTHREDKIGDLIVYDSEQRVCQEIRQHARRYEQITELRHQRWSWVNKLGGLFLHTSVVLLLACLMFFAAQYVANLIGMGSLLSADSITGYMISVMFILLIAGGLLVQFIPWGSKKLMARQIVLDKTLKVLDSS